MHTVISFLAVDLSHSYLWDVHKSQDIVIVSKHIKLLIYIKPIQKKKLAYSVTLIYSNLQYNVK